MFQLFSTEFLKQLRTDSNSKIKTSKAILDAMRDLTAINQSNKLEKIQLKKLISELKVQVQELKQENQMLAQLLEAAKSELSTSVSYKQTKLAAAYELEAKLVSQNQSLKRKIDNLELQLNAYKQMTQRLKQKTQMGSRQDLRLSGLTISKKTIRCSQSQFDLQAYLTNEKRNLKSSRSRTVKSIQTKKQRQIERKSGIDTSEYRQEQKGESSFFEDINWRQQSVQPQKQLQQSVQPQKQQHQQQKSLNSKSVIRKSKSQVQYSVLDSSIFNNILHG